MTNTQPTDAQLDAALLETLANAGGDDLHPWAVIRRRLPGTDARQAERLTALWLEGRVWLCKARGRNYVGLGDADDVRLAATARAEGRVRCPLDLSA